MAKAREVIDRGQKDAFFIYNPESIVERVRLWRELLPEVELFYAVKSNSDEIIVQKMLSLGCKFDCASKAEIEKVL
jgi:ornithine decarboxylase